MIQVTTLQREKSELVVIQQTLDSKLGVALAKADAVPALEIENKDLVSKNTNLSKKLESALNDISSQKATIEELNQKVEEAKKAQAEIKEQDPMGMMPGSASANFRNAIRQRPTAGMHSSRPSRYSNFFQNFTSAGFKEQDKANHQR